ncbi:MULTISPECIES: recombinase family protein [unclassified Bradyrhizobium]|uniref:recombinase family protein n=1 Tax=unclassified Bradyrhizobium TaxID=2631580 RepID=UPI001FF921C8|nr:MULTISPECIES: recombinase family protein [unclassified Bradyrhizobium]MCK1686462.1 recombinase family protein [Bradyrhizobium sp. 145]UPJ72980.1 recombinase family protein [Bradyrhizobium sp. 187]
MDAPVRTEALTKAYSYVRFSTPSQAAGASLQRQTDKAKKYALDHGLVLDTELNMTDLGVSAYRGKNAHTGALGGFLKAVEAGYVARGSYLLIENMDRLSRADIVTAQGLFLQLVGSGINLVTLTNEETYSAERFQREPEAIFLVVLELIRANKESVRKGQLVGDAKARKKQRLAENGLEGKPYTRQTPAWLTWSDKEGRYKLIPERADIVREMFERMDKGDGLTRIARDLNQRGVATWARSGNQRTADHWRTSYIRKVLSSSAPIGTFTPHTTTHDEATRARRDEPMAPVENLFPAAVDADTYWRVNRKLSTKAARGRNAKQPPKSIVSGIIFCATCGHSVTRVAKGDYVYLVCSRANMKAAGCDYKAVRYDTVEMALRENARHLIKEAPRGKSTTALEKQIEELQANADRVQQWVFDLIDLAARDRSPSASQRRANAERELKAIQKQLRDLRAQRDTMTTASVKDRLKAVEHVLTQSSDVTETNATLRDAMRRVVLDPVQGHLWIRWHHSEEIQDVPCGTRHMDWAEMRETTPPMHALFPEKAAADTNGQ